MNITSYTQENKLITLQYNGTLGSLLEHFGTGTIIVLSYRDGTSPSEKQQILNIASALFT